MTAGHEDITELVETEAAVHVIFRVDRDWEADRQGAVAEAERKVAALRAFFAAPAFRERFGRRVGVLRMRTPAQPPSIVAHLLSEAGVEIEAEDRPPAQPGEQCALCGRAGLWEDQASMTERGWACVSCFRAWGQLEDARLPRPGRLPPWLRLSGPARVAAVFAFLALCVFGAYWTLSGMSRVNHVIRAHVSGGE